MTECLLNYTESTFTRVPCRKSTFTHRHPIDLRGRRNRRRRRSFFQPESRENAAERGKCLGEHSPLSRSGDPSCLDDLFQGAAIFWQKKWRINEWKCLEEKTEKDLTEKNVDVERERLVNFREKRLKLCWRAFLWGTEKVIWTNFDDECLYLQEISPIPFYKCTRKWQL